MLKPARTDLAASVSLDARPPRPTTRVWDPFVRLFHWSLVLSFGVAWFSSHPAETLHHWAGYAAAALILMRLLWGMIGTRYARFSQFVRKPATVARYLSDVVSGKEARYVGHNPAGGVMVMALIAAMATTALTGWMMTTDAYFGVEWVEAAHSLVAHGLLMLVLLHLCGVVLASVRHHENLIGAMASGRKREAEPGDVA